MHSDSVTQIFGNIFFGANSFSCPAIPVNCGFRHHACFEYEIVTFPPLFITTDFYEVEKWGVYFLLGNCHHHHHHHHHGRHHHHHQSNPNSFQSVQSCGVRDQSAGGRGIVHSLHTAHTMAALFQLLHLIKHPSEIILLYLPLLLSLSYYQGLFIHCTLRTL